MRIARVSDDNTTAYVSYCQRYGAEHDESFLPNDAFVPTDDYPAYLLYSEGRVVGAVGLMRTQPYVGNGKVRLTILHSIQSESEAYALLLAAIREHTGDSNSVYGFLPEAKAEARRYWEALGFEVERFAYLLAYRSETVPDCSVPEEYHLTRLKKSDEVGICDLCNLWNRNYGHQPGFVGADPKRVVGWFDEPEYIPGGALLLLHDSTPVGTAWVGRDNEDADSADVSMLSVHPDYRGRGLGRLLLRKAVEVALSNDLSPVYLSVDAANASAVGLYLSEGFIKDKVMVCYTLAMA
ncbi:GNAT family N-acetyltransferase [Candidatus Bipolaricaulota bacterium]|nr:GNAT family N-acetyltransferase [Candidatus Bipolaricaulota bacterium]